ncbi:BCSC C-terminal domain-containing protein (plasmid) [Caballeronia sp. NK8]|uniref:cellulose synthase subunit BcsC-related outer membrane protein n=1 Tax=Caballeronia sp. NK8 TaxID=140098 RepID=UPI001BB56BCD|nr:cellulose synthase subunit BcsC-related outer membrane protein [Caballeronia sp. NK8]BCQ27578.1 BCSC C-terminal domain-containing protein [Caballeronia sp. NK8]
MATRRADRREARGGGGRLATALLCAAALPSHVDAAVTQGNVVSAERGAAQGVVQQGTGATNAIRGVQQRVQTNVLTPEMPRAPSDDTVGTAASGGCAPAAKAPATPDERPLWNLLHAKRLVDFDAMLARVERRFPTWTPPASLVAERTRQERDMQIRRALAGDVGLLRAQIAADPDAFGCAHIDRTWSAADLLDAAGDSDAVYALYRPIVAACEPDVNRVVTLQRAAKQLPPAQADVLIDVEWRQGRRGEAAARDFARLRNARVLDASTNWATDETSTRRTLAELAPSIRDSRDGASAIRAAWLEFALHDYSAAAQWFELAIVYGEGTSDDATLGLAQVRVAQGDLDAAEGLLARPSIADDSRTRALRGEIAMSRASEAYRQGSYRDSLAALDGARDAGVSDERVEPLRGWNLFALGDYEQAERVFDAHYQQHHDDDSAEGIALSVKAQGRHRPSSPAGPLPAYIAAVDAQNLYYEKQFVEAQRTWRNAVSGTADAQRIAHYLPADLTGIDAPSITGGSGWVNHAGVKGENRLTVFSPTLDAEWFDASRVYEMRYRQLFLNNGINTVNAEELQGKLTQTVRLDDGRTLDVHAIAGVTQGGPFGASMQGEAGVAQTTSWGAWSAYAAASPVRDSLLSWRGESVLYSGVDPATGAHASRTFEWGRVTRATTGGSARWQIGSRWNVSAGGHFDWLTGHEVDGNEGLGVDFAASYDLRVPGFDYLSIGPALHYLGYRRNENFFVPTQGGYYSPQMSTSAGAALQFLSQEGRSWQVSGNVETGWNYARQSAGSCPVSPFAHTVPAIDCSGSTDRGPYAHVQFAAALRVAAHWQIGALADLNVTPGRDRQVAAIAYVRYFLSPRNAVFSRDLPHGAHDLHLAFDESR